MDPGSGPGFRARKGAEVDYPRATPGPKHAPAMRRGPGARGRARAGGFETGEGWTNRPRIQSGVRRDACAEEPGRSRAGESDRLNPTLEILFGAGLTRWKAMILLGNLRFT